MDEWQDTRRLPDPRVQVLDARFAPYRLELAKVERLATGCRWAEGPVWFGDHHALVWSDVSNNRLLRWDERTGETTVFRAPSDYSNGNTRDAAGHLVTCEQGRRRVTRTEFDGRLTVLADQWEGRRLNSPNDVVGTRDGAVWFTDPPFGILTDQEGYRAIPELPTNVYRVDPAGRLGVACAGLDYPNGVAFSPDERTAYIVESRGQPRRRIVACDVADGTLVNPRTLVDAETGAPDGLRVDEDGNLWCGWGGGEGLDGVRVYTPTGDLIGYIDLPERCANVEFGGRSNNRLFMAATSSVYALFVNTRGAR
ncbi:MAG: SMP-30/gluconolactonase/LRE family protein [Propionibacteriaceae bacterium]|jgi:gluconolactonase|nr:SMP-30/gluconolactonase/LRE family protein [Propionibacteriaceae bacterium]